MDSDRSDIHQAWTPRSESRAARSCGVCKREDIFISTPTGSRKFLCYSSLPPMSIVVVVSPLKALMPDQVSCKHLLHTGPGISVVFYGALVPLLQ